MLLLVKYTSDRCDAKLPPLAYLFLLKPQVFHLWCKEQLGILSYHQYATLRAPIRVNLKQTNIMYSDTTHMLVTTHILISPPVILCIYPHCTCPALHLVGVLYNFIYDTCNVIHSSHHQLSSIMPGHPTLFIQCRVLSLLFTDDGSC